MVARCNFVRRGACNFLISIVLLLAAANVSQGALINWDNDGGSGNQHWSEPNNWDGNSIPYCDPITNGTHADDAQIILTDSNGVIYDAGDDDNGGPRYVYFIPIGVGAGVSGEMWMNGGSLYAPWGMTFNKATPAAGNTANSTLHMTGGLLHLGPFSGYTGMTQGYLTVGRSGTSEVDMIGGTIRCESLQIPLMTAPADTVGTVNLDGGVIKANSTITEPLDIDSVGTGVLNITGGKLILKGDKRTRVNGYVSNSKIVPYPGSSGRAIVNVDYGNLSDANTTVTASLTEPNQAWKPRPIDTHPGVTQPVVLIWNPGDDAASHDVYFGTSFDDVNDGLVTPVPRDVNYYSLGALTPGQTYYWRVDEVNEPVTTKGVVWSFAPGSSPFAANPSPTDGATGVATNATLSWTAGVGATSHDVYFGISFSDVRDATDYNVLPGRGRQSGTSYNPGTLVAGQKYYWRIDEYDGSVVYKGNVWSFTVTPAAKQAVTPPYLGDLIGYSDGAVTWEDLDFIASTWLTSSGNAADLNWDNSINFKDYSIFAKDWLKSPPEYSGSVYYVATSGSDSYPGTSSQPWATIQKAAGLMTAGDTVIVRPGTYYGQVTVANSGSSQGCGLGDLPITFLADPAGDVTLNANGSGNNGFYIVGKTYVVVDGFKITGGRDGIFFDGDGYSYHEIRNCKIYSNGRDGIRIYQADRVTVEKCLLYGNTTGVGIKSADDVGELQVSKCGMYGNDKGLELDGSSDVNDCIITNNTTYGVQGDASQVVTYSDVWNNDANYYGGIDVNTGCISADPCYVNPVTDFHLLAGSPCIGEASDGGNMGYKYPPIANAGMDRTVYVDEAVTFDGSASRGSITSYDWDFGDTHTDSGQVVTHTYTSAGTRTVSLEVDDGTTTDTDTCKVEVLSAKLEERVYHVINLNASGAGSLAGCLSRANSDNAHSRIVFDVNGIISPGTSLHVTDDYTTICGTEAPGNGITINFGGFSGSSGIAVDASNCRFCNIHITQTEHNSDGLNIDGNNNIVERCTMTWCRDEGISLIGGHGNIAAFNRIEFCGSQPEDDPELNDGRGFSVWYDNTEAIVVGNYIGDNLRGALCGDYTGNNFMDFRNNLVTLNHQTFGLKVSTYGHVNIIDNTIINNNGVGIKYESIPEFYRSGNILSGNSGSNETFNGTCTEVFSPIERTSTTPYPNWLKNVTTPADETQVGMGSGKCQCVLCR